MTVNSYGIPVDLSKVEMVTFRRSPAHIGRIDRAVDFICKDAQVFAAADGIVKEVDVRSDVGGDGIRFDKYGNYILIGHQNLEYSCYEHLRKGGAQVKVGEFVRGGQPIGYSGATGYLGGLGDHLHFDVHYFLPGSKEMPDPDEFGDDEESRKEYFSKFPYKTLPIKWISPRKLLHLLPENEKARSIELIGVI
jgi:murein DD-endopeptidase MepM/ murein hydrolase activator NlpD